jgi:hypothetical protein
MYIRIYNNAILVFLKMRYLIFFIFFGFTAIFSSCKGDRSAPDVTGVDVNLNSQRFDIELFSCKPDSIEHCAGNFEKNYGRFYYEYLVSMTGIGEPQSPGTILNLKNFIGDKYMQELYNDCLRKYQSTGEIDKKLNEAFRYYKYYFPEKIIPEIVYFISGFQYSVAVTENQLGIGLDLYLGKDYKHYTETGLPMYRINQTEPEYLVSDAIKGWLSTEIEDGPEKDMLAHFVFYGRLMYLLDAMLPEVHDSLKFGFTADQIKFCEKNEYMMWAHFVDNNLIYNTESSTISKYFSEGPFTSGFPKDSPAKTGIWIGRQIVKSYMEKNPDVEISSLIKHINPQELFRKSGYKPKK